MKCVETRTRMDGVVRRRYRVSKYRTVTTLELPMAVVGAFSKKRLADAIAKFRRGEESRNRKDLILDLLAEGWKPTAIAHQVGVTEALVRKFRGQLKKGE